MSALLWKDYRLNRPILIVALAVLIAPYLVALGIRIKDSSSPGLWGGTFASAALTAMAASLLTISLLAANAFAQERAERSAEFLAFLPPSRSRILLSKLVLVLVAACVQWGINLVMGLVVAPALGGFEPSLHELVAFLLPTCVLVFAAGWAASTVLASPVGAWGIAMAAPIVIIGLMVSSTRLFGVPTQEQAKGVYVAFCFVVAVPTLVLSSLFYVRRMTP